MNHHTLLADLKCSKATCKTHVMMNILYTVPKGSSQFS